MSDAPDGDGAEKSSDMRRADTANGENPDGDADDAKDTPRTDEPHVRPRSTPTS